MALRQRLQPEAFLTKTPSWHTKDGPLRHHSLVKPCKAAIMPFFVTCKRDGSNLSNNPSGRCSALVYTPAMLQRLAYMKLSDLLLRVCPKKYTLVMCRSCV